MSIAGNLIVNGDFANGATDWTMTGGSVASAGAIVFSNQPAPGRNGVLEQAFQTVPGETYTVTFRIKAPYAESPSTQRDFTGTRNLELGVSLRDGSTLIDARSLSLDMLGDYTTVSFTFVATGTETTLSFEETSVVPFFNSAKIFLDDVSVVAGSHVPDEALDIIMADASGGYRIGTDDADRFVGGDGNDTFYGFGGNDVYDGGSGDYNQVDLDGAVGDWSFHLRGDGALVGTYVDGREVLMRNIDGVYFQDGTWKAFDALYTTYGPIPGGLHYFTADGAGDYLEGTNATDFFGGRAGNDTFYGRAGGGDIYRGGGGDYNQINLDGNEADYTFTRTDDNEFTIAREGWVVSQATDIDGIFFLSEGKWMPVSMLLTDDLGRHVFDAVAEGGYLAGTGVADVFNGSDNNDTFYGGKGDDVYYGADGYNQVDLDGSVEDWTFTRQADGSVVAEHAEYGRDTFYEIDAVWFGSNGYWSAVDDIIS